MYFLTVWLKKEDSEDFITHTGNLVCENIKTFCKTDNAEAKISPSGRRLTATLPCDDFDCQREENIIDILCEKIKNKCNRSTRAKAKCSEN